MRYVPGTERTRDRNTHQRELAVWEMQGDNSEACTGHEEKTEENNHMPAMGGRHGAGSWKDVEEGRRRKGVEAGGPPLRNIQHSKGCQHIFCKGQ